MKCYLYECSHEQAGTWGMLLPWNVKPEWPGVTVERILPTLDEAEGMTCLEAQRVLLGPVQAVGRISRPALARPLPP